MGSDHFHNKCAFKFHVNIFYEMCNNDRSERNLEIAFRFTNLTIYLQTKLYLIYLCFKVYKP